MLSFNASDDTIICIFLLAASVRVDIHLQTFVSWFVHKFLRTFGYRKGTSLEQYSKVSSRRESLPSCVESLRSGESSLEGDLKPLILERNDSLEVQVGLETTALPSWETATISNQCDLMVSSFNLEFDQSCNEDSISFEDLAAPQELAAPKSSSKLSRSDSMLVCKDEFIKSGREICHRSDSCLSHDSFTSAGSFDAIMRISERVKKSRDRTRDKPPRKPLRACNNDLNRGESSSPSVDRANQKPSAAARRASFARQGSFGSAGTSHTRQRRRTSSTAILCERSLILKESMKRRGLRRSLKSRTPPSSVDQNDQQILQRLHNSGLSVSNY